jgi:hypothetical protein
MQVLALDVAAKMPGVNDQVDILAAQAAQLAAA